MSIFYYFISNKPLSNSKIDNFHLNHYSICDVTSYDKDARRGYFYYSCNPASIYFNEYDAVDKLNILDILHKRETLEENVLSDIASEFSKLGDFEFIRMWEDTTRCDTGYHEAFFRKCIHDTMSYSNFCESLLNYEKGIEDDIYYSIKVVCNN